MRMMVLVPHLSPPTKVWPGGIAHVRFEPVVVWSINLVICRQHLFADSFSILCICELNPEVKQLAIARALPIP